MDTAKNRDDEHERVGRAIEERTGSVRLLERLLLRIDTELELANAGTAQVLVAANLVRDNETV